MMSIAISINYVIEFYILTAKRKPTWNSPSWLHKTTFNFTESKLLDCGGEIELKKPTRIN